MEDDVGDRALKRLPQRKMNFIDDSISSYCYMITLPKRLEHMGFDKNWISQEKLLYDYLAQTT